MQIREDKFCDLLRYHSPLFHNVVKFDHRNEKLISFDLSKSNIELKNVDTSKFSDFNNYVFNKLKKENAKFGIGGYNELRYLYGRSDLFNRDLTDKPGRPDIKEPRRLHIGIDIWGEEGTEVFAVLDGIVHSFAYNDHVGDYGATIILQHCVETTTFFTLYGHLSLTDIASLNESSHISKGQLFAHFGNKTENGNWPPHLHFQIIKDIFPYKGDYPGVCKLTEAKKYLENCPNPDLILNMNRLIS